MVSKENKLFLNKKVRFLNIIFEMPEGKRQRSCHFGHNGKKCVLEMVF